MCDEAEVYWSRICRGLEKIRSIHEKSKLVSLTIDFKGSAYDPSYQVSVTVSGYIAGIGHTKPIEGRPDQVETLINLGQLHLEDMNRKGIPES